MGALTSGQFVDAPDIDPITFDTGDVKWSARRTAAAGWLKCDGSANSRTVYAALFAAIVPSLGTFTVTLASPGVFTLTAHGLVIGDQVYLTTTGALPTGLAANTIYYVVSTPTADTFTLSATLGGSAINTSGSQSGTHTLRLCPYGLGDGSTTFNLPDAPGRVLVAAAGSAGHADVRALGANDGIAVANRRPKHQHTPHGHTAEVFNDSPGTARIAGGNSSGGSEGTVGGVNTHDGGSGVATDAMDAPANLVMNLFIKT